MHPLFNLKLIHYNKTMNQESYVNENGDTVFKSSFYRKKGSCCKSSCLHCPYGHTLRTIGVKIEDINENNLNIAKSLYDSLVKKDDFTSSLLNSAFKSKEEIKFDRENFKILTLKGFNCGLLQLKNNSYEKHFLKDFFSDQGIDDGYLSSITTQYLQK